MFQKFLIVGYLRGTSNYLKRITLSDPTHMMSMVDPVIGVKTLSTNSGCSLEKDFTELIHMKP